MRTIELEGHLGNQREVYVAAGDRRSGSNKTRLPAHQLYQADAVQHACSLGVSTIDNSVRLFDGRCKSKRPTAKLDVVVDCFGKADDGNLQISAADFKGDFVRPALRAIA